MMQSTLDRPPSSVLNVAAALPIADNALRELDAAHEFVILPTETIECSFGWVFFYVPQRFRQSGNPSDLVPGNGPLVVYRESGRTEYLSSSVPPAKAIAEVERRPASDRR